MVLATPTRQHKTTDHSTEEAASRRTAGHSAKSSSLKARGASNLVDRTVCVSDAARRPIRVFVHLRYGDHAVLTRRSSLGFVLR